MYQQIINNFKKKRQQIKITIDSMTNPVPKELMDEYNTLTQKIRLLEEFIRL